MDFDRFIDLCAQSARDFKARDTLWSQLHDYYYEKLRRFAGYKMNTRSHTPRKLEADDFAVDAIARLVQRCLTVESNIYGALCSDVIGRISDEARRDDKLAAVKVDDGLESKGTDEDFKPMPVNPHNPGPVTWDSAINNDPLRNNRHAEPLQVLLREEEHRRVQSMQTLVTQFREELKSKKHQSRTAYYMAALIEKHHGAGITIRDLAEDLSKEMEEKGEKPVSYGNLRNVNVELVSRLRALLEASTEGHAAKQTGGVTL